MERLLNIKEAAEFLNVAEITIRRWTNQGLLHCYRLGNRKARRFRPEDLTACLNGHPAEKAAGGIALGIMDATVPDGSHITHLSQQEDESLKTAAAYILEGFRNNETVEIVATEERTCKIMNALEQTAPHMKRHSASGRLRLSRGLDSPEAQKDYLMDLAAKTDGRLRVFGDMSWTRSRGWSSEELTLLEKAFPACQHIKGCILLCQYALDNFGGREIMMAMETHTHSIYRDRIIENPYCGNP